MSSAKRPLATQQRLIFQTRQGAADDRSPAFGIGKSGHAGYALKWNGIFAVLRPTITYNDARIAPSECADSIQHEQETGLARAGGETSLKLIQGGYGGLRGWIDQVERMGELKRVSGASWDAEMGAITHMLTEHSHGTAPALLFDDIPGISGRLPYTVWAFLVCSAGCADPRIAAGARTQSRHRQAIS